ncbi:hypothetical protein GXW82_09020 [Streptacidiphilus sp. 4-A2]|nr:hypothetical protein [Streptacidiphilus sp. 4-A2]
MAAAGAGRGPRRSRARGGRRRGSPAAPCSRPPRAGSPPPRRPRSSTGCAAWACSTSASPCRWTSPELRLREQLGRIPDPEAARAPLEQLDQLDRLRRTVAAAAGDPLGTHEALEELGNYLGEAAGRTAAREKRQTLYGRSFLYQDSRRDLDVTIGGDLVDALRAPLAILLDSARWLAAEAAEAVSEQVRARFRELRARSQDVRLSELYLGVADVLAGAPGTVVDEVSEDFRLRWAELLDAADRTAGGSSDGEVRLSTDRIAPLAAVLFPHRRPAWSGARYHSPDLMLARTGGPDGPVQWVLGELHVALNTLESRVFHTQSDDRDELRDAVAADMGTGRVLALQPNDSPEVTPRTYPPLAVHVPGAYAYWSFGRDSGAPEGRSPGRRPRCGYARTAAR